MWWGVSLMALVLLALEAAMVTFVLLVALNGFSSLPDVLGILYLVCTGGSIPLLSWLDGSLAIKLSETHPSLPLWLAGLMTTTVSVVYFPLLPIGLTVVLLLAFGMI